MTFNFVDARRPDFSLNPRAHALYGCGEALISLHTEGILGRISLKSPVNAAFIGFIAKRLCTLLGERLGPTLCGLAPVAREGQEAKFTQPKTYFIAKSCDGLTGLPTPT